MAKFRRRWKPSFGEKMVADGSDNSGLLEESQEH